MCLFVLGKPTSFRRRALCGRGEICVNQSYSLFVLVSDAKRIKIMVSHYCCCRTVVLRTINYSLVSDSDLVTIPRMSRASRTDCS